MRDLYRDSDWPGEMPAADLPPGERVIRSVLLAGFLVVLGTEIWLLWQWLGQVS